MNRTYEQQRTAAQKIADADVKERVLRGLEVVRVEYGEDWVDHIDPQKFDILSCYQCVLGQLEGYRSGWDYHHALRRIDGEVERRPQLYGFDITGSYDYGDVLEDAWLTVIGAS